MPKACVGSPSFPAVLAQKSRSRSFDMPCPDCGGSGEDGLRKPYACCGGSGLVNAIVGNASQAANSTSIHSQQHGIPLLHHVHPREANVVLEECPSRGCPHDTATADLQHSRGSTSDVAAGSLIYLASSSRAGAVMAKDPEQRRGDQQDNKRVFRWGIGVVVVLVLAALIFNSFIKRPVAEPSPAASGTSTPASTPQPLGAGTPR